jgi:hypothetical protein
LRRLAFVAKGNGCRLTAAEDGAATGATQLDRYPLLKRLQNKDFVANNHVLFRP